MYLKSNVYSVNIILLAVTLLFSSTIIAQKSKDSLAYYRVKINQTDLAVDSVAYYYDISREFVDFYEGLRLHKQELKYLIQQGHKSRSRQKIKLLLKIAKENKCPVLEGEIHLYFSNYYYYYFGQYALSYKESLKSIGIFEAIPQEEITAYNTRNNTNYMRDDFIIPYYLNIGTILARNGDFKKAEEYYKTSLNYAIKKKDKSTELSSRFNLIVLDRYAKKFLKANIAIEKLENTFDISPPELAMIQFEKAENYIGINMLEEAERIVDKLLASHDNTGGVKKVELYFFKSKIAHKRKKYAQELYFLNKSLEAYESIDDTRFAIDLYKALAESETLHHHIEVANKWYQKTLAIQDSLVAQNEYDLYNKIEIEHEIVIQKGKHEDLLKIIKAKKKRSKFLIWTIVLGFILSLLLVYILLVSKKNSKRKIQLDEQNLQLKEIALEKKRLLKKEQTQKTQDELVNKRRELMLLLLNVIKRKSKTKKIEKVFNQVKNKAVISQEDISHLKKYIVKQSKDLDRGLVLQQEIVNTRKGFFVKLLQDFPDLSKTELRLLAYIKSEVKTKEIAENQHISVDAVRKTRHRIRKKIGLSAKESLEKFIAKY